MKLVTNVFRFMMFATWIQFHLRIRYHTMHLDSFPVFNGVDIEYIALLQPFFEHYSCPSNSTVFAQGAEADFLYLIESGKVEISYKPYDAEAITITHIGENGLFGWSALIGSRAYTSSALAMETLIARRIRGRELRKFCVDHPEAGHVILDRLAEAVSSRWEDAFKQVRALIEDGLNQD